MAVGNLMEIVPNVVDPSLSGKVFWFYGEPGTRKTSIAAKFPSPLFVATENGYKFISGVRAVKTDSWNDMKHIFRQLKTDEVREEYKTIVFDRADSLYEYCKQYVCSVNGVQDLSEIPYSAGYTAARKEFNNIIKGIENLGYGMVFITHNKVDMEKTIKQDLENNAAKVLRGYADFTFYLAKEEFNNMNTVVAYSEKNDTDTKARPRYFAPYFEFTFENLEKELKKSIEKQIEIDGIEVKVKDRRVEEQRSFEELRDNVIKLYSHLVQIEHPKLVDIGTVISGQMKGVRLSEATPNYYDNLLIIETYLLDLE